MHAFPPTVANGTYRKNLNGWYEVNNVISITCNKGYEHTGQYSTAKCLGGVWSSLPSCQQLIHSCLEPPKIPHTGKRQCLLWTQMCNINASVDTPQWEDTPQHLSPAGMDNGRDAHPALQTQIYSAWSLCPENMCATMTLRFLLLGLFVLMLQHGRTVTENDGSTTGTGESVTPSSGVGLNRCGEKPIITNGVIVQTGSDYLKYACPLYYKLEGSDTVRCLNNGLWTPLPFCREAFCHVNTEDYPFLINIQAEFLLEGEKKRFKCVEKFVWSSTYSEFECMNGIVKHTGCCRKAQFLINMC
ncbi:complement factor H-like isoform X2 [Gouania willdenowi]|uniref:complement factor H-like isoform X2 n=1 Tax=Gouania willdenowi TaxID=441366 RepID=UPI001056258F|nr:complement factor H-like isoform X2 [Gouania willdenowi]